MVTRQEIQDTCDAIVREFEPIQIFLFGSHAYGNPTEESDVDLLVVMPIPRSEFRNKAVEIRQRIPYHFSMDLLVRSPEEITYRVSYNDWFLREITEKGELLHGPTPNYKTENTTQIQATNKKGKEHMNPLTLEWIEKAEEDYNAAKWLQQSPNPLYNSICFHIQQCIEKYLKAWLQEANIPFTRTHDLDELLNLILPTLPIWQSWGPDFKIISTYAVESRYPGDVATFDDTQHALRICEEVRQAIRTELIFTQ